MSRWRWAGTQGGLHLPCLVPLRPAHATTAQRRRRSPVSEPPLACHGASTPRPASARRHVLSAATLLLELLLEAAPFAFAPQRPRRPPGPLAARQPSVALGRPAVCTRDYSAAFSPLRSLRSSLAQAHTYCVSSADVPRRPFSLVLPQVTERSLSDGASSSRLLITSTRRVAVEVRAHSFDARAKASGLHAAAGELQLRSVTYGSIESCTTSRTPLTDDNADAPFPTMYLQQ